MDMISTTKDIPSPFGVGDEVECRIDGGGVRVGIVKRILTFPGRQAFHVVETLRGEEGFGTNDLTLVRAAPLHGTEQNRDAGSAKGER